MVRGQAHKSRIEVKVRGQGHKLRSEDKVRGMYVVEKDFLTRGHPLKLFKIFESSVTDVHSTISDSVTAPVIVTVNRMPK